MHPIFGINREKQNHLFYKEYTNTWGTFMFHSQIELHFVLEGEMNAWINNRHRVLKAGEMSVALSFDAHAYRTDGQSSTAMLIIPTYLCEEFIATIKNRRCSTPFILDKEVVAKILSYTREIANADPANKIKIQGYVYVVLGMLMEHLSFEETDESFDPSFSSRILFYLDEHFKENLTTESIAIALGYSPSYLSRYFKSCFQIGIHQYLTIIRLKHAVMLLNEEKRSVTYCAMESGFNSMRTFYRAFEAEFGCSPGDYLKQIKAV